MHASCLMKMSCLVEVIPSHGLKNTMFRGDVIHKKSISMKELSKVHVKYNVMPQVSTHVKMKL